MKITRREWLGCAIAGSFVTVTGVRRAAAQTIDLELVARRVGNAIKEFEAQGFHRTGTAVDNASGDWLAEQVRQAGLSPSLEPFSLSRVDPITSTLLVGGRTIEGVPLFDAAFTDAQGISGRLGTPDANSEIVLTQTAVNVAGAGPLGEVRRAGRCKGIVAVTQGRRPGLCPSNADSFQQPFGPPVLQVSSEEAAWLTSQAKLGANVTLITHVARTSVTANNIVASIQGADPALAPLVIMTPRSGWYWCASERGGGIAIWLEAIRALRPMRPQRSILFVASSGHELGHAGINAYIERRPGIVKQAVGWLHLGANIGAAIQPSTTLQASDDEFDAMLTESMMATGLSVTARAPRGRIPAGEAEAVHLGGGRYVSAIGGNELFHSIEDRGSAAIDPLVIARFSAAFSALAGNISRVAQRPTV
ncbi:MAG: hypothetical protein AB7I50_25780 [Vicinamibacterales bacterium]